MNVYQMKFPFSSIPRMANRTSLVPSSLIILLLLSHLISITGQNLSMNSSLPRELLNLEKSGRLRRDVKAIKLASRDFGNFVHIKPKAVLYPSSVHDIVDLVRASYKSTTPFGVAAKGHGHSVRGQAMVEGGVVVEMTSLNLVKNVSRIKVLKDPKLGFCVDAGGEQLWIDVLKATLQYGLSPISWADYLYLTVGGTLSNAGISGQSARYGPQINNVYELDVITGKGELVTCSKKINSDLFYAVLGGLGQFGIITRARIRLDKAPTKVKWVKMIYNDFSAFIKDQEHLISTDRDGLDFVEGYIIMDNSPINNWRSSFFSNSSIPKISSLLTKYKILYCLDAVKYYYGHNYNSEEVGTDVLELNKGLSFIPGFTFNKDLSYMGFLNRIHIEELKAKKDLGIGLWDFDHPWLNIFVPKSRIMDFHKGVFVDIIHKQNIVNGPIIINPILRNKWDDRMSVVIPDEDIFYAVSLLSSSHGGREWRILDNRNKDVLHFCTRNGIGAKEYIPNPKKRRGWIRHFGLKKWESLLIKKMQFDPKKILSPRLIIFN